MILDSFWGIPSYAIGAVIAGSVIISIVVYRRWRYKRIGGAGKSNISPRVQSPVGTTFSSPSTASAPGISGPQFGLAQLRAVAIGRR